MEKFFNTEGPVNQEEHYKIDPLSRLDLDEILNLIRQKKYFVLHAPRQTGKTSCLLALRDHLNQGADYQAVYCNVEAAQAVREDIDKGISTVCDEIIQRYEAITKTDVQDWYASSENLASAGKLTNLLSYLSRRTLPKKTVLLIDEVDSLVGDTLISVLRQIRSGYDTRPEGFPQNAVLCGVRDVRDYRIHSGREKTIITGGSAFNIKAESLRLGDFSIQEIESLLAQHTYETGQEFDDPVLDLIWDYSEGQPWLVNALGAEATYRTKSNRNRNIKIRASHIHQAKENLILRRDTHIDQLVDKLQEERVKNVLLPMITGTIPKAGYAEDDVQYLVDLGLVKLAVNRALRLSNRIYKEIIPREITMTTQINIVEEPQWYLHPDGTLNMTKLLEAFRKFYQKNIAHWSQFGKYHEAGPQLLLMAFLQRIINGGGRIEREYGLGRERVDLFIEWPAGEMTQTFVVEMKVLHDSRETTIAKGLEQTRSYMDSSGALEGHLMIFDQNPEKPWQEKTYNETRKWGPDRIHIWGT